MCLVWSRVQPDPRRGGFPLPPSAFHHNGQLSHACTLPPLLRSVVESVMQAAAHIPSHIRDAPRSTKDGNFDLAGGGGLPKITPSTQKSCSLLNNRWGLKGVWR